jgi:long-chain acyl-CoA synthetase
MNQSLGEQSLGAMLHLRCSQFSDRPAMQVPSSNGFEAITYRQLGDYVRRYSAVLQSLGLGPGDSVAILSENCAEWAWLDWACQTLGLVLVPIYPTLPAEQVGFILGDSGAKLVAVSTSDQLKKVEALADLPAIFLRSEPESIDERAKKIEPLPESDVLNSLERISPDAVATLIYTSGTTGNPKGVQLTHRAFLHVLNAVKNRLPIGPEDVFLCFLPMSHVYERVGGQFLPIFIGGSIGFAKSLLTLGSDIAAVRPTVLLCVPRFLEQTREKILDGVAKQSSLKQKIFHLGLQQGIAKNEGRFAPLAAILDKKVGAAIRQRMGGRMRFLASAGAALAPHVAEFYAGLGFTVLQAYGLTETTGGSFVNHPDRNDFRTVGEPLDIEFRIAEDGEILLKGPPMMKGYHNQPEETAKVLTSDGWFHTGDIGELDSMGRLRITDRKKDLLKLSNGKYVAPQPIENKLKAMPSISEAVVFGDGMEFCTALIVPNFEALRKQMEQQGVHGASDEAISHTAAVIQQIKSEVQQVNRTLTEWERIKKHHLLPQALTIDSGELTPTMKVKRKVVRERYGNLLQP